MKLYHGTANRNAEEIEINGFLPSQPEGFAPIPEEVGEVVFFTDSIESASEYGDAIFEIETEGKEVFYQVCPMCGINEYYIRHEETCKLIHNRVR